VHVLRDTRRSVQGDRGPDRFDILLRNAVASQEVTGGIRAVNFEALIRAAVLIGKAHIMEHRACIKQFGIKSESATLACQSTPPSKRRAQPVQWYTLPPRFIGAGVAALLYRLISNRSIGDEKDKAAADEPAF